MDLRAASCCGHGHRMGVQKPRPCRQAWQQHGHRLRSGHTPHPHAHGRPHLRLLHAHAPNGRIGRSRGSRGADWRHHRQQHLEPRPPQKHDHHDLMLAGISSAFGAVFGSPLAGAFFGMEMCFIGKIDYTAGIYCWSPHLPATLHHSPRVPSTKRMSSPAFPA